MKCVQLLKTSQYPVPCFIFLPLILFCCAFGEKTASATINGKQTIKVDTIPVKDLNTINWDNLNRLVPFKSSLIAEVEKETYIISRKDYEVYARQNGKVRDSKSNLIFTKVEIEPEYPGGAEAWSSYLKNNMIYPKDVVNSPQGTVVVQFIVDQEGNLRDLESVSGPTTGGLRDTAIKLVRESGKWHPAIQNSYIVKSYKKQAVTFRFDQP